FIPKSHESLDARLVPAGRSNQQIAACQLSRALRFRTRYFETVLAPQVMDRFTTDVTLFWHAREELFEISDLPENPRRFFLHLAEHLFERPALRSIHD